MTVTLVGVGTCTIQATQSGNASYTAAAPVSQSFAVILGAAGLATHFSVTAPSSVSAGVPFPFTVTALDMNTNTVIGFGDPVAFTSSDASASLPGGMTLTNGVGTFSASLVTIGLQTITAAATGNFDISGTSAPIPVGCTNEGANWSPSATTISLGTFCFQAGTSITVNSGFVVNGTAKRSFHRGQQHYAGPWI